MGGTKPKTGGLAALLRIEKERLAREASGEESSQPPLSERTQTESSEGAHANSLNPSVNSTDKKNNIITGDPVGEGLSPSNRYQENIRVNEEVPPVPLPEQIGDGPLGAAQADDDSKSGESFAQIEAGQGPPVPVSKISETRQSSNPPFEQRIRQAIQNSGPGIKGAGSNRLVVKKGRTKTHYGKQYKFISTNLPPELQTFVDRWKPFLTETQLNVCIYVYNNSVGLGLEYCFTSTPKLMSVVSKTERQIKTVLGQLITLNFINRGETVINAPRESRGTFYKLNLNKS
jgi:hypothetical protein